MLDIQEIRKTLGKYAMKADDTLDYILRIIIEKYAIKHFGRLPYLNSLSDVAYNSEEDGPLPMNMSFEDYDDEFYDEDEIIREKRHKIDAEKTVKKLLEKFPDTLVYHVRTDKLENAIFFNELFIYYHGVFYMDIPTLPEEIKSCLVEKEEIPRIRWILRNAQGRIQTKFMDITPKGCIADNYNDDFEAVDKKVTELIHKDESSIIILHGKPGTGKTSYIRDLIANNSDINFYWIDSSMFNYIDSSEFIEFIASCKNAVFILEDSESLLVSREESKNPAMQSLLSISDGMLGDSLKLKFICTFNTELNNIDEAIKRKGRCKIKYEFKPLKKEKVKRIFEQLGINPDLAEKDMPLCDVYNFLEDNGVSQERAKIGF